MTTLIRFKDNKKACNAAIEMFTGDRCYVNVAKAGVVVKKWSPIFGAKLYKEKDVHTLLSKLQTLRRLALDDLTPVEMESPALKVIVNTILHCENLQIVAATLNDQKQENNWISILIGITRFFKRVPAYLGLRTTQNQ